MAYSEKSDSLVMEIANDKELYAWIAPERRLHIRLSEQDRRAADAEGDIFVMCGSTMRIRRKELAFHRDTLQSRRYYFQWASYKMYASYAIEPIGS